MAGYTYVIKSTKVQNLPQNQEIIVSQLCVIPTCPSRMISGFVFRRIPDLPKAFGIAGMTALKRAPISR